ncbi:MAG: ECF transporter S component [Chitinophagales bacterium]
MALTHSQKRERIASPTLSDLQAIAAGALGYALLGAACGFLPGGLSLFRPAPAVVVLAALTGGPVVGFGAGFLGDLLLGLWQGGLWLHWSLGVGVAGALTGLLWLWSDVDAAPALSRRDLLKIACFSTAGFLAGALFSALVDLALGAALPLAFLAWALPAWLVNTFWGTVLGSLALTYLKRIRRGRVETRQA